MPSRPARKGEHAFSIETDVAKLNETGDRLLIEGFLGELEEIGFVEDVMLEIRGVNAILRMELKEEELRKLLQKGRCKGVYDRENEGRRKHE